MQHFTASLIRQNFAFFLMTTLLVGLAWGAIPLPVARAAEFTVPCDVTELRNTINAANGNGQADTINLAAGCTYTLPDGPFPADGSNGLPSITSQITINGHGATIARASGDPFRILHVASGGNLTLTNVTITNGNAGSNPGGGIMNSGGTLNITNSTLYSNTAYLGGGVMNNGGTLNITTSTLSGNTGSYGGYGGGVCSGGGALNITNSTLSGNTAANGGGIYKGGSTVNVKNTILAGNTPNNCDTTVTSQGYNLESGTDCGFIVQGQPGDQWDTQPDLGPLADNGGPTWTHALLEGSPAADHIPYGSNGCGTDYTTDQRGYDRPFPPEGSCDVGAYEQTAVTFTIACHVAELINVINIATGNGQPDIINLPAGCTYTLTVVDNNTDGSNGLPSITSQITINGHGATIARASGDPFRILHVASGGNLTLTNVTITNGNAGSDFGGGIFSAGTLNINDSTLSGNTASAEGGGGIVNRGTLNVSNSTLSANTAKYGGGIYSQGGSAAADISHSTLTGNTVSLYGGGVINDGTMNIVNSTLSTNTASSDGGSILNNGGTLGLNNDTLSANTASNGGGIYNSAGTVIISHNTFSNNVASSGGGIYNYLGIVNTKNTILAGNTPNNCVGTMTSQGYNLESGTDCGFIIQGQPGDQWDTQPDLGPLADNGGPTWTHALLSGSQAINYIPNGTNGCGSDYTTDQRTYLRPYPNGGNCDIGAYEYSLFGDVDGSCTVDINDVMAVASRWRTSCDNPDPDHNPATPGYEYRYDLDYDCDIDIVDIMLAVAHWEDKC